MMSLCEFQDSGEFQSNTIAPLFFEVLSLVDRFLFAEDFMSQLKKKAQYLAWKKAWHCENNMIVPCLRWQFCSKLRHPHTGIIILYTV